jgi:hypothetical protein
MERVKTRDCPPLMLVGRVSEAMLHMAASSGEGVLGTGIGRLWLCRHPVGLIWLQANHERHVEQGLEGGKYLVHHKRTPSFNLHLKNLEWYTTTSKLLVLSSTVRTPATASRKLL